MACRAIGPVLKIIQLYSERGRGHPARLKHLMPGRSDNRTSPIHTLPIRRRNLWGYSPLHQRPVNQSAFALIPIRDAMNHLTRARVGQNQTDPFGGIRCSIFSMRGLLIGDSYSRTIVVVDPLTHRCLTEKIQAVEQHSQSSPARKS